MEETKNNNEDQFVEPILKENNGRFVLFPIEHDDIWQFYKKANSHTKRTVNVLR